MGLHSLPVSFLVWGNPALGSMDSMVGFMVEFQEGLFQGGFSRSAAASAPIHMINPCQPMPAQETPSHHEQVVLVQSPMGSLLLSSDSWCMQCFVCALQDWSLYFPQSCGNPIIKFHWPSRSDSLGIPSLFFRSPGWEA